MTKKTKATPNLSSSEPIRPRKRTGPQCTAHKKNGQRCGNPPIRGGTTCKFHGGAAKQVRAKATERLMEMVLPALAKVRRIMLDPNTSDADALKAAQMVLNRTGFSERFGLELAQAKETPWDVALQKMLSASDDPAAVKARETLARMEGKGKPRELPPPPSSDEHSDDSAGGGVASELDQYNNEAMRRVNRQDLDIDATFSNEGHDVVRGEVVTGPRVGPIYPRSRKQEDEPSEFDPAPAPRKGTKNKTRRERYLEALGEDG